MRHDLNCYPRRRCNDCCNEYYVDNEGLKYVIQKVKDYIHEFVNQYTIFPEDEMVDLIDKVIGEDYDGNPINIDDVYDNLEKLKDEIYNNVAKEIHDVNLNIDRKDKIITAIAADVDDVKQEISLATIDPRHIGFTVTKNKKDIAQLLITANEIRSSISDDKKNISVLQQTAEKLEADIKNAKGDISNLKVTADEIRASVKDAEGNSTEALQTAREFMVVCKALAQDIEGLPNEDTVQSMINATANQITLLVTKRLNKTEEDLKSYVKTEVGKVDIGVELENKFNNKLEVTEKAIGLRLEHIEEESKKYVTGQMVLSMIEDETGNLISQANIKANQVIFEGGENLPTKLALQDKKFELYVPYEGLGEAILNSGIDIKVTEDDIKGALSTMKIKADQITITTDTDDDDTTLQSYIEIQNGKIDEVVTDKVDNATTEINNSINAINGTLASHGSRIETVENKTTNIVTYDEVVDLVKGQINTAFDKETEDGSTTYTKLVDLVEGVIKEEMIVTDATNSKMTVQQLFDALKKEIDTIVEINDPSGQLTQVLNRLSAAEGKITNAVNRVGTLESTTSSLETSLDGFKLSYNTDKAGFAKSSELTSGLNGISARVSAVQTDIEDNYVKSKAVGDMVLDVVKDSDGNLKSEFKVKADNIKFGGTSTFTSSVTTNSKSKTVMNGDSIFVLNRKEKRFTSGALTSATVIALNDAVNVTGGEVLIGIANTDGDDVNTDGAYLNRITKYGYALKGSTDYANLSAGSLDMKNSYGSFIAKGHAVVVKGDTTSTAMTTSEVQIGDSSGKAIHKLSEKADKSYVDDEIAKASLGGSGSTGGVTSTQLNNVKTELENKISAKADKSSVDALTKEISTEKVSITDESQNSIEMHITNTGECILDLKDADIDDRTRITNGEVFVKNGDETSVNISTDVTLDLKGEIHKLSEKVSSAQLEKYVGTKFITTYGEGKQNNGGLTNDRLSLRGDVQLQGSEGLLYVSFPTYKPSDHGFEEPYLTVDGDICFGLANPTWLSDIATKVDTLKGYESDEILLDDGYVKIYSSLTEDVDANVKGSQLYIDFPKTNNSEDDGLVVDGIVYGDSFSQTSDMRYKNYIEEDNCITFDSILNAPWFKYTYKDSDKQHVGSSAQYWQMICPDLVNSNAEGRLGLNYSNAALGAVITLAKKIKELEDEIKMLKGGNV